VPRKTPTEPRKLPRQSRSKATVDALLTAAARILKRDGYDRASVNKIAALAGVSVGSLYQYFPSKEALVAAVIKRHSSQMVDVFHDGFVGLGQLPLDQAARGVVRRAFAAYAVDPALRKVILEDVPKLEMFTRTQEFDQTLALMLRGYFEYHRHRIRPRNLDLAVKILMTCVESITERFVVHDAALLDSEELIDEVTTLVLGYVAEARVEE